MKMNRNNIINLTGEFVRQRLAGFESGHDWSHVMRVRGLALYINSQEQMCDAFTLEIAALLHDIADSKFTGDQESVYKVISVFMFENGMSDISGLVIEVIKNVSFSSKNQTGGSKDPLLMILQDADRLDAIGAIGIARAFNYGGFRNRPIYSFVDDIQGTESSTISHFYDKLLKLKDLMNTRTGRHIAEDRHAFLLAFLEQFYKEWEFES